MSYLESSRWDAEVMANRKALQKAENEAKQVRLSSLSIGGVSL